MQQGPLRGERTRARQRTLRRTRRVCDSVLESCCVATICFRLVGSTPARVAVDIGGAPGGSSVIGPLTRLTLNTAAVRIVGT